MENVKQLFFCHGMFMIQLLNCEESGVLALRIYIIANRSLHRLNELCEHILSLVFVKNKHLYRLLLSIIERKGCRAFTASLILMKYSLHLQLPILYLCAFPALLVEWLAKM